MNTSSFLDQSAISNPDAVAFSCAGVHLSYAELVSRVNRVADSLRALGCQKGSRIAYAAGNRPEAVELYYAAARLGAVFAPICGDGDDSGTMRLLTIVAPDFLLLDKKTVRLYAMAAAQIPSLKHTIVMGGKVQRRGCLNYDKLLAEGRNEYYLESGDGSEPTLIFFTSGFTDAPKAAAFCHNCLAEYIKTAFTGMTYEHGGAALVSMPLYNIAGFISVLSTFYFTRRLIIMPQFDAGEWIRTVREEQVTRAFIPACQLSAVLAHPDFDQESLFSLTRLQYGGDAMPPALVLDALKRMPSHVKLRNVYGFTEAICKISQLRHEDYDFNDNEDAAIKVIRLNSIGRARSGVDMIISDGAKELPRGEIGEVLVRTPYRMIGYVNPDTHDIEPYTDEWLHSTDMGYMDDKGYIFLVGHKMPAFIDVQEPKSAIHADSIEIFPCVIDAERLVAIPAPNSMSGPLFLKILDSLRRLYQCQDLNSLRHAYLQIIPELLSASAYGLHLAPLADRPASAQALDSLKWDMPTFDCLNLTVLNTSAQSDASIEGHEILDSITLQEINEKLSPDYWLCAPMFRADHTIIGVLSFIRCGKDWPFTSYEQGLLRIVSNHMGLAIANALDRDRLKARVAIADEVLEVIEYGVTETDEIGRVLFANRSAAKMLNDSKSSGIERAIRENIRFMNERELSSYSSKCDSFGQSEDLCVRSIRSDGGHLISLLYPSTHTPALSSLNGLLSQREFEILTRLASGLSNMEIAKALCISENTVKFHLKSMFKKLGACNRAELLCKAYASEREYAWHQFN